MHYFTVSLYSIFLLIIYHVSHFCFVAKHFEDLLGFVKSSINKFYLLLIRNLNINYNMYVPIMKLNEWRFISAFLFYLSIFRLELRVCLRGSSAWWQDDIELTALSLYVTDLTGEALRHDLIYLPRHWIIASENISFAHIHTYQCTNMHTLTHSVGALSQHALQSKFKTFFSHDLR